MIYEELLDSVRQKIVDALTGTCISCLLALDLEEHSCEPDCFKIISHFPFCFNRIDCSEIEKYRLKVLGDLLVVFTGDRRLARHHLKLYKRENRDFFRENQENYVPFLNF